MRGFGLFTVAALMLSNVIVSNASAQSSTDHMALITETSSSEFDVAGALEVDHVEALALHEAGATFIDVRRENPFKLGHIAGAINLEAYDELTKDVLVERFAHDEKLVFYCSGTKCARSARACAKALTWGFTDVVYFAEGWPIWLAKGFPKE